MIHKFRLEFTGGEYPRMMVYSRATGEFVARISHGLDWKDEYGKERCYAVGYNVAESFQGRGVMSWVLKVFMFKCTHLKHFQACCWDHNLASQRVLEKCGFKLVSKGRIYHYEFRKDSQYETLPDEKRSSTHASQRRFGDSKAA